MTLVWVEPFDQYGNNNALPAQFGYTDVTINFSTPGRTGTYAGFTNNYGPNLRRALNTPFTTGGMGIAYNPTTSPSGNAYTNHGLHYESAGKIHELSAVMLMDNSIGVYDRTGTLVGKTSANSYILSTYTWFEVKVINNTAGVNTGSCEVRINGVSKVIVNGINLPNAIAFVYTGGFGNVACSFDDWIVWDNAGTKNNDFMGDRRLVVSYPNANSALQNFTASAGNAFACVNQVPPVDTTYIDGAAAGNISEFTKTAIGIASNDIAAAVVIGRMFKTDAGVASGRIGINSAANVSNSAELFPGTTGSWFQFFQELDPNGNIAWTQANYDAAILRITRVQ